MTLQFQILNLNFSNKQMGRLFYVFVHLVEQYCKTSDIPGNYSPFFVIHYSFSYKDKNNNISEYNLMPSIQIYLTQTVKTF